MFGGQSAEGGSRRTEVRDRSAGRKGQGAEGGKGPRRKGKGPEGKNDLGGPPVPLLRGFARARRAAERFIFEWGTLSTPVKIPEKTDLTGPRDDDKQKPSILVTY